MKNILFLLFLFPTLSKAQLTSFVVRDDTIFCIDPLTGTQRQLTKFIPSTVGQSGRVLSTNGANYSWVPATQAIGVLPFANGGREGSAATPATTGTMTVSMVTSIITITPTGACTFNASGGTIGQIVTFIITTSGTSSFILTWGTNYRKTGTLATGTTNARFFSVSFVCVNGTIWQEIGRTAAQT